jgi:hypothetical protein
VPSQLTVRGRRRETSVVAAERRQHPRNPVAWVGWIETAAGKRIECAVLDFSAGGAKALLDQALAIGEEVVFKSPRAESVAARIVWCEDGVVGMQFVDNDERVMKVLGGKDGEAFSPERPEK